MNRCILSSVTFERTEATKILVCLVHSGYLKCSGEVVTGLRSELAQERKLAEIRAFKLRDNQTATDEERKSGYLCVY